MKLAIIHHHLNRGGVAQAIADHVGSLDLLDAAVAPEQVAVIFGGRHEEWPADFESGLRTVKVQFVVVEGLDYDSAHCSPGSAELADNLTYALTVIGFSRDETLLHVHNHSLGKNVSLPGALCLLAERGYRQLLQIHDFAEDFRPQNYRRLAAALPPTDPRGLADQLYPQAPHIHYAVLNDRDHAALRSAGVAEARTHLLPNAVADRTCVADRAVVRDQLAKQRGIDPNSRYLLYPARGIRRKNLGEALLWATLFRSNTHVGITLPPINQAERPAYDRWRGVAARLSLPCAFETGHVAGVSLAENFLASDHVLTTSVAEGFGLLFLESYLAGRVPIGRNLPEVTADFERNGVSFPALGERLNVPVHWLGLPQLVTMFERTYNPTLTGYGRPGLSRGELVSATEGKIDDGFVDFADLDALMQEQVLCEVNADGSRRSQLLDANQWMTEAFNSSGKEIARSAEAIRVNYSHAAVGEHLLHAYREVMATEPAPLEPLAAGHAILDSFLKFDRFRAVLA